MVDKTMEWLRQNDPDYGQMGEDVYGDVFGISTRPRANRRKKYERALRPELLDTERAELDHCPACRRRRQVHTHTVA